MAAKVLSEAGAEVVLLEAGPTWSAPKNGAMFAWSYSSPRRGAGSREKPFGEFDGCLGGWDIEGEPYPVADGQRFLWFRARMLGGRTNHWGRISLRFGPLGLQGSKPRWRRRRLAHHLRRHQAVLRQAGRAGRNLRYERRARQRAGRHFSAAARAALLRAADEEGLRLARHHVYPIAAVCPHAASLRPARLPLLWTVRARLLHGIEFLNPVRTPAALPRDASRSSPAPWRAKC